MHPKTETEREGYHWCLGRSLSLQRSLPLTPPPAKYCPFIHTHTPARPPCVTTGGGRSQSLRVLNFNHTHTFTSNSVCVCVIDLDMRQRLLPLSADSPFTLSLSCECRVMLQSAKKGCKLSRAKQTSTASSLCATSRYSNNKTKCIH